jgi:cytochrome c-type biogenesis protein
MELGGGMGDFLIAFLAGVVSFLSPCVLPLIPGYLSFITGVTPNELASEDRPVMRVLVPSLLFVLGYVLGAFVFVMGFFMLGIVKVPWLYGEARMEMGKARAFGQGASFVMGMAFAFGWTPCVGPILASILAISMQNADAARGAALLAVYSLGLGVPFVLTGLLFGRLKSTMGWLNRHALVINRVAGVLLMVLGALIFFDKLSLVAGWFLRYLPSLEVGL